jgi:opacity protein-like surface antigen
MNKFFASALGVMLASTALAGDLVVTGTVGNHVTGSGDAVVGISVGSDVHKNLRVEGAYEYDVDRKKNSVFAHVMPQAQIPTTSLTPYALVGVGVDVESLDSRPMYVVGAGVRLELTKAMDVDFRFRRIDTVDNRDRQEVVTGGLSVKF